jgi:hypothetical protein
MKTHKLKIEEQHLCALLSGAKKSEIRINDRAYQINDKLALEGKNEMHVFVITHIHHGLGMQPYYVVLSLEILK